MTDLIQGTDEWKKMRAHKFTFSNTGTLLGVNHFSSLDDLYRIFVGAKDFHGNESCRYGTATEDPTIDRYVETIYPEGNATVKAVGFYINRDYTPTPLFGWSHNKFKNESYRDCLREGFGGSPDGLVVGPKGNVQRVIEVKNPHTSFHFKTLQQTKHYQGQVVLNMFTTKTTECDFIVATPQSMYVLRVQRPDTFPLDAWLEKSPQERDFLASFNLFDEAGRFTGYFRVMVHIIAEFYWNACQREKDKRHLPWCNWALKHRTWIDLINAANAEAVDKGKVLYANKLGPFVKPKHLRCVQWTALLTWQTRPMPPLENATLVVRGFIPQKPEDPVVVNGKENCVHHFLDVFPEANAVPYGPPSWDGLYIDIYAWNGRRMVKAAWEWSAGVVQPGFRPKCPPNGVILLTRQRHGTYVAWHAGPWTHQKNFILGDETVSLSWNGFALDKVTIKRNAEG